MSAQPPDDELQAVQSIVSTLEPLGGDARQRVLLFSLNRLGIKKIAVPAVAIAVSGKPPKKKAAAGPQTLRDLRREKAPRFATHMAAVVAYYLSALAPAEERKNGIGHQDIKAYFKKAGFKLPKSVTDVLIHARQSGYFEYLGDEQYKLTPQGRDLVVNDLPTKKK